MKKILPSIAVFFILLSCTVTCFASEYETSAVGNTYAKYNYFSNPGMYAASYDSGQYTVQTDEGIQIIVYGGNSELLLVVHQITSSEPEAFRWFESCTTQVNGNITPFDIFFLDSAGNRQELPLGTRVKISIQTTEQYVCALLYDGTLCEVTGSFYDGYADFTTTHTQQYYLLCDGLSELSPHTGATSMEFALVACCVLVIIILLAFVKAYKKHRYIDGKTEKTNNKNS